MQSQTGVAFTHTIFDKNIIGLLEANSIPIKVPDDAILHHGAKAAVEENAGSAAAVQRDILLLVALDDEVLDTDSFQIVATDDGEYGGGLCLVCDHAISVERRVEGERVSILAGYTRYRGMETTGLIVPDGDAATRPEAIGVRDC